MDNRLHFFVLPISLTLITFTVFLELENLFVVFILLTFFFSLINTVNGICIFIYGLPIAHTLGSSLFTPLLMISLVAGTIIKGVFIAGQKQGRIHINFYDIHLLTLLLIVGISTLYYNPYNIARYSYFVTLMLLSTAIIKTVKSNAESLLLIVNSIIFSGLFLAIISLILSDGNFIRLSAPNIEPSSGIRILANSISCSTIFLYLFYFYNTKKTKILIKENRKRIHLSKQASFILKSKYLLLAFFILILIMTSSRGSIVAVTVCIVLAPAMSLTEYLRGGSNNSKGLLPVITIIFVAVVLFIIYRFNLIDIDYFLSRFQSEGLERGSNIRTEIWLSGIEQMEGIQLLIGYGLGSFRDLAIAGGYDFYAHSFLIDFLASSGVFGTIVILSLTMYLLLLSFREGNHLAVLIIVFCNLLFLTHGDLYSIYFWFLYSISYSTIKVYRMR